MGCLGVVLIGLLRTYSEGQQRCQVGRLATTRLLVIWHWPWSGVLFPLKKVGIDCDNVSTLQLFRRLLLPDDNLYDGRSIGRRDLIACRTFCAKTDSRRNGADEYQTPRCWTSILSKMDTLLLRVIKDKRNRP